MLQMYLTPASQLSLPWTLHPTNKLARAARCMSRRHRKSVFNVNRVDFLSNPHVPRPRFGLPCPAGAPEAQQRVKHSLLLTRWLLTTLFQIPPFSKQLCSQSKQRKEITLASCQPPSTDGHIW